MKFGITKKVNVFFISIIILFCSGIGWYFLHHERIHLNENLDELMQTLTANLSKSVVYPVLIMDTKEITRLVENTLSYRDALLCRIKDKEGNILFQKGTVNTNHIRTFTTPILADKGIGTDNDEALLFGETKQIKEEVGTVELIASLENIKKQMGNITRFILLSGLYSILFIILITSFLSKIILGKPIGILLKGITNIASGDLGYKIKKTTDDEIGLLADSFNKMSDDLSRTVVSKDYFNNIIQSMADSLVVVNTEGKITMMNKATESLLGYTEEELLGQHIEIIFEKNPYEEEIFTQLIKNTTIENTEKVYLTKKGDKIPVLFSSAIIHNRAGESQGVVCLALDITERKEAERKQMQLLQELKEFAYVTSHDLKAPIRGIATLTNWLSTDYGDKLDENGKEQINLLLGRVNRMQNLITGILEYSKIGRDKEERVEINLNKLVRDIINNIPRPENIEIKVENDLPSIISDRTRISQIFYYLLHNAVKYMDKSKGEIAIHCRSDNGNWHFNISDNGPGIDEKYFKKIFQIFQTLNPRDEIESTGTGLTLAKKIIETNGGNIWIESEVGKGSSFHFTLPQNLNVPQGGEAIIKKMTL
jgi:PAS domain S-box-containing protein